MPSSMTGFGRAEISNNRFEMVAEVRALNNRYLEISIRLPKSLSSYEYGLKEVVKRNVLRGKISITITFKDMLNLTEDFVLKKESVRFYRTILEQIRKEAGIEEPIKLEHFLQFSELLEPDDVELKDDDLEKALNEVMENALISLNSMRREEGLNMVGDIRDRLTGIALKLEGIDKQGKETPRRELEKLAGRLDELIRSGEVDRNRLELELALISDRVDITEECTRMRSHLQLFRDVLDNEEEVGKKLTFILQEMQRESNTIGSKTTDISIAHSVIGIKEEIEKIREQVQNLE
jgi:uncharacterized protein (TIGR00255 family)